jgi:hypothetical protein
MKREVPKAAPRDAVCPYCGRGNDVTVTRSGTAPVPGTVCVCAYCFNVCVLGADTRQRKPTDDERAALVRSPQWPHVTAMIEYAKALRSAIDAETEAVVKNVIETLKRTQPPEPK